MTMHIVGMDKIVIIQHYNQTTLSTDKATNKNIKP